MLDAFTYFADWLSYSIMGFKPDTPVGTGVHFFIEDASKILVLLMVVIYVISYLRASLSVEKVRDYLSGKNRGMGYVLGSLFGAITPFCSCSSIPLFMEFVSARIPIGITIAFLITSPLINEVVVIMLGSILGLKFTVMYVAIGMLLGILAGMIVDFFKAYRWLQPFLASAYLDDQHNHKQNTVVAPSTLNHRQRHTFAMNETRTIVKRIWKWVIIGVGIGAFIHGFVPAQWFEQHLSNGQWWTVPLATLTAIPIYTNASGVVPIMASLIQKGMPLGTTLAFCMGR
ncbi:putative permease [Vibrio thalassae]|uniref:Putative permease n=1 Tax=Vibrio thalassae TaxID=1243014 RepID=A0A240ENM5_9VIBR|nr:putative permease [Vibrio thalassae]